jgi:hypothetical protein
MPASFLFLPLAKLTVTSGPLHLLYSLPGTSFLQLFVWQILLTLQVSYQTSPPQTGFLDFFKLTTSHDIFLI